MATARTPRRRAADTAAPAAAPAPRGAAPRRAPPPREASSALVRLAGGNPRVAKADGDAPVRAWLAAVDGWRGDTARRLDALVVAEVPNVRKAVKWNSPFYGVAGGGWFFSMHVFTRFVKVTFFKGTSLAPAPAGGRAKEARWIDVHEGDLDDAAFVAQLSSWLRQAAAMPGWMADDPARSPRAQAPA